MNFFLKLLKPPEANQTILSWAHFAIGLGLLAVVVVFDACRLFDRQWSFFYFLVAIYVWWFLRGRAELFLYGAITLLAFLIPIFFRTETRLFNRTTGAMGGWIAIVVMRDRRRFFAAIQQANNDLNEKVSARTSELNARTSELMVSHSRLEVLSRQLIKTQESERSYLARELHDEFGQVLCAMKMNLKRLELSGAENRRAILEEHFAMIDQCVGKVRDISLNLRPPQLDELGLSFALDWYLKKQARIAGLQAGLVTIPPEFQVPRELATICFRIAQEAVTNAITHSVPKRIDIELKQCDCELQLKIHDDGQGFDVNRALAGISDGTSFGLSSMRERAALANGKLEIRSSAEDGTTIHATFPLSRAEQA